MEYLPDQFHIDRIRHALWRGSEFGRAAVMVGAGFSLNARPTSVSALPFPTWAGLTGRLVDDLYPEQSVGRSSREYALAQAGSTSGALRLAEEYQAAFGRDALDRLIIAAVPDASYEPSPLHSLLLRLPWSDVFTTNYDTLLERAARGLVDRKYDVVRTAAEVPGSARPRIIKLHGSLPSNRPFIITEEDFRTYPERFAPLVNLTQQSMMENAFCLLGFSGDDPNFLHWSGWVRDNLGRSAPVIYLCGLLDLNSPRRKLLHDRHVIPIDLSPLFPPGTPNRHATALEWFLRTLDEGRWLPSPRKWPYRRPRQDDRSDLPEGMPEIPKPVFPWFTDEGLHPKGSKVPLDEEAVQLLEGWRRTRESYPGWVVAPAKNRDSVWTWTDPWIHHVSESLPKFSPGMKLSLLYELNWRLEICLVPLWPELAGQFSETLRGINPFPGMAEFPWATTKLDDESLQLPPTPELRRIWIELAHACLRFYRELQDDENFGFWRSILDRLTRDHPGLAPRIRYQECLLALGRIDHRTVRSVLNDWSVSDEDPFWLIRQAAILVELGELDEAEERAEAGLRAIREGIRPEDNDLAMLSREGWAMKLVDTIRRARKKRVSPPDREFTGRWERLAESGCNPYPELDLLKERLKRPVPADRRDEMLEFSFDFGRVTRSHQIGTSLLDQFLPALQVTRLVEEAAYPPRCGSWNLSKDLLNTSATWLRNYWPSIAMSLYFRLLDKKVFESHFDRNTIAYLPEATILGLHRTLDASLDHAMEVLACSKVVAGDSVRRVAEDIVEVAVGLLSRFVLRLPQELIVKEVRRAMALYRSPVIAQNRRVTDRLGHLFHRAINALDPGPLSSCVLELFSLPIPGIDGFTVSDIGYWPEPTALLGPRPLGTVRDAAPGEWSQVIQWLLQNAAKSTAESRRRAALRLAVLWEKGVLTSHEIDRFASVVWSIRNGRTGLPASTGLLPVAFLSLPEPEPGVSTSLLKSYCLASDFVPLHTPATQPDGQVIRQFTFGTDPGSFLDTILDVSRTGRHRVALGDRRWVNWNKSDLMHIFGKIGGWWEREGRDLCSDQPEGMVRDRVLERHAKILKVIWGVLIPGCRRGDELSARLRDLVLDLDASGLPVTIAFPPLLRLFPDLQAETIRRIREGVVSRDKENAEYAMGALVIWATKQVPCGPIPAPPDLLRDFSSLVSSRALPALYWALGHGKRMVELLPRRQHGHLIPNFLIGLDYLLEETRYRGPEEMAESPFRPDQIPEYRYRSSLLAVAIARTSSEEHPTIKKWLDAIRNDPMPEIRRALDPTELDDDLE